jgi:hypothetical protein
MRREALSMPCYKRCRQWLVCSLTVVLSACVSVLSPAPHEERAAVYNFFAVTDEKDNDFSYRVTGNIAATGMLVYMPMSREPALFERFYEREEGPPPLPSTDTEIIASGVLRYRGLLGGFDFVKIHTKNPSGYPPIWLVEDHDHYMWDGEIAFNDTRERTQFDIYTYVLNGGIKLIETYSAEKQQIGMEFAYAVTDADAVITKPPFKWGKFISDAASYGLYSGVETDYYATYPDFTKAEWKIATWAPVSSTKLDSYFKFFLKPGQKFQMVNSAGLVVAEIYGNIYTIYDTLPESEWDSMKHNMALFYVYRLIARRFFYSNAVGFSF